MKMKKGDTVVVISGKEKGKRGRILMIAPGKDRVIVEALNMMTHHERPSRRSPQGGMVQKEVPIHVSNLMVVCTKCGKPARLGKRILENDEKVRVCKKCSEIMDAG